MPNPGAFRGSRKDFLMSEKAAYDLAVSEGFAAEAISNIQRRYFKRYPVDLPHDVEPTREHLESVDDDMPEPEPEAPDRARMTQDEYEVAVEKMQERRASVNYRKAQIKRWFSYQYGKDHDSESKDGLPNPYALLTQKLLGKDNPRPRLKVPVNMWRVDHRHLIEQKLLKMEPPVPKGDRAKTRESVARALFLALDIGEQRKWQKAAQDDHKAAMSVYNSGVLSEPSTNPEERQRAIQGLIHFVQPILDAVCQATGWRATMIAGGPEPAQDGQLSVLSIHSGFTSGDIKMNFGRAERLRYKKMVVPIFGSFLQKCYTPEECKARALPKENNLTPMSLSTHFDDDLATIDSVGLHDAPVSQLPMPAASAPHVNDDNTNVDATVQTSNANLDDASPFPFDWSTRRMEMGASTPVNSPAASPLHSPMRHISSPINSPVHSVQCLRPSTPPSPSPGSIPPNLDPALFESQMARVTPAVHPVLQSLAAITRPVLAATPLSLAAAPLPLSAAPLPLSAAPLPFPLPAAPLPIAPRQRAPPTSTTTAPSIPTVVSNENSSVFRIRIPAREAPVQPVQEPNETLSEVKGQSKVGSKKKKTKKKSPAAQEATTAAATKRKAAAAKAAATRAAKKAATASSKEAAAASSSKEAAVAASSKEAPPNNESGAEKRNADGLDADLIVPGKRVKKTRVRTY